MLVVDGVCVIRRMMAGMITSKHIANLQPRIVAYFFGLDLV